ncbi:MAG TPA: hybrid sensor histidine kinase/response regulator [Polyangiaceae bacterium]|nr:hybrid sensor histidine kinase/response regulator [Polyangiaceae bacterium]
MQPDMFQPNDAVALEGAATVDSRYAQALEALLGTALAQDTVAELSASLSALLQRLSQADVAILYLREGSSLVCKASAGVELTAVSPALPLERALNGGPLPSHGGWLPVDDPGSLLPTGRCQRVYGLALCHGGQLVAVLHLGWSGPQEVSDATRQLLSRLAASLAAVIVRVAEKERLARDVQARDDVLGVVAHDLQNPLNVISTAAHMLLHRVSDAATRRPVERIIRGVERATRLLRDLLDIGAMEEGQFAIDGRRLEPAALILSALESQQALAADASVITAADLSPDLPSIDADEERLLEVLENLIGNAIKFTNPGGTVQVGAARNGEDLEVWVKDNGAGITSDQLPHIFDRFWQAKRADRRGTGLGLTICKGIVEAHGGAIWADSSIGQGTTVHFTIPAVPPLESVQRPSNVANILLVDDRPENLLALKSILDRPDYRLVTADSGELALRLALRETFSVALIDIAMPNMNGLEVAAHLKELERCRDIPIIFVTAFGDDPEEIHRAYAAGGADYLVKPLDAEIVKKKVAVFVDLSRRRHDAEPSPRSLVR